jgi:putative redox protein
MADTDKELLESSLTGYKAKIVPVTKTTLTWKQDLVFSGTTPQGYEIEFDADAQWGCKPTEALLMSLSGCMGIDMVMFLTKMRVQLSRFSMEIEGRRNPDPPQYFKAVTIIFHLAGKNLDTGKIDRAVALSRDKYCSVYNSLRKDLDLQIQYVLEENEPSA